MLRGGELWFLFGNSEGVSATPCARALRAQQQGCLPAMPAYHACLEYVCHTGEQVLRGSAPCFPPLPRAL
jgi:hypothetical protein